MSEPSRSEVERVFLRLLQGEMTREDADVWASKWVAADQPPEMHRAIWEALKVVDGCDLRDGPGGDYLHSDTQIAEWLETFRQRIST